MGGAVLVSIMISPLKIALIAQREAAKRGYTLNPMFSDNLVSQNDPPGLYLDVSQITNQAYLYSISTEPDADEYAGLFPDLIPLGRQVMYTPEDAAIPSSTHHGYIFIEKKRKTD